MSYNVLVKNFEKARELIREYYLYGIHSKNDIVQMLDISPRTYDDDNRRVHEWLKEYVDYYIAKDGKVNYVSIDARQAYNNPLFKLFKTKLATKFDIKFYFFVVSKMVDKKLCVEDIIDLYWDTYMDVVDDTSIIKKLMEYEELGIVKKSIIDRKKYYEVSTLPTNLDAVALSFFKEEAPVGVIGSFLKEEEQSSIFRFKQHFLLPVLESEVLVQILEALYEHKMIEVTVRKRKERKHIILPLKIYSSTQTGRIYVYAYTYKLGQFQFYLLDRIHKVVTMDEEMNFKELLDAGEDMRSYIWGVSLTDLVMDHIELDIHIKNNERYILKSLIREARIGTLIRIDEDTWRYVVDTYDAEELLSWIRSYIGYIERFVCSNEWLVDELEKGIAECCNYYGK